VIKVYIFFLELKNIKNIIEEGALIILQAIFMTITLRRFYFTNSLSLSPRREKKPPLFAHKF
jgi:hypothetical protein